MSLCSPPNEVLLSVTAYLDKPGDVYALMRTSRRFAGLSTSRLHDLATLDKDGKNALVWAAFEGYIGLVRVLLGKGFDVNIRPAGRHDGKTPLYRAVQSGNIPVVKLLLENGADIKIRSEAQETVLHEAAGYGSEAMVTLLLDNGAGRFVTAVDNHHSTPIHWAAACKNETTLRVLLERDSYTVNTRDVSGHIALQSVIYVTNHADSTPPDAVVKQLLDSGFYASLRNSGSH